MSTPEQRVRDFYGFAFPEDFFRFRELLDRLSPDLLPEACDLNPGFPFRVAAGLPARSHPDRPHWEDRYYHDLPEFLTLFHGTTDGLHWGYFFDAPGESPPVVAHYWHSDTFEHGIDGDNLFEAVRWQVETSERDYLEMMEDDPDEAEEYQARLEQLAVIRDELASFWEDDRPEVGDDYLDTYGGTDREPTERTRSRLGIVVPADRYRALSADLFPGYNAALPSSAIERLIDEARQRIDQGYPGAALKLGHDLWVTANDFPECYALLDAAYAALGRTPLRQLLNEARAFRAWCDKGPR